MQVVDSKSMTPANRRDAHESTGEKRDAAADAAEVKSWSDPNARGLMQKIRVGAEALPAAEVVRLATENGVLTTIDEEQLKRDVQHQWKRLSARAGLA